ncbi:21128_t:CDS:2 [Entrophospora sp. SA101]|nr:21128_t:CDS:2 [Entrophospora sp. SA101]
MNQAPTTPTTSISTPPMQNHGFGFATPINLTNINNINNPNNPNIHILPASIPMQPQQPNPAIHRNQIIPITIGGGGLVNVITYIIFFKRKRITQDQLIDLMSVFEKTDTPSYDVREKLAKKLKMTNREVQVWFQNRRAKANRAKANEHNASQQHHRFLHHHSVTATHHTANGHHDEEAIAGEDDDEED